MAKTIQKRILNRYRIVLTALHKEKVMPYRGESVSTVKVQHHSPETGKKEDIILLPYTLYTLENKLSKWTL